MTARIGLFYDQPVDHDNPRRFYGKICAKHPTLQGERRRLDGECIACHDERPPEMTDDRWSQLMNDERAELTPDEIKAGWHFCFGDWDGLLIGPGMKELEACHCGSSR